MGRSWRSLWIRSILDVAERQSDGSQGASAPGICAISWCVAERRLEFGHFSEVAERLEAGSRGPSAHGFRQFFEFASRSDAGIGGEFPNGSWYDFYKPTTGRFKRRSATHLGVAPIPGAEAPGYRHAVAPRHRHSFDSIRFPTPLSRVSSAEHDLSLEKMANLQSPAGLGDSSRTPH